MRQIGSQTRETLEEAGLTLHKRVNESEVILTDTSGKMELWCLRDDFAGHVVEIDGKGYEFCATVTAAEVMGLLEDTDG